MTIHVIDKNTFKLFGLPQGMNANWQDEGYWSDDEFHYERLANAFYSYVFKLGYDTYKDENGDIKRWYGGCGLPKPDKSMTDAIRTRLEKRWLGVRIKEAALATPELQALKKRRYRFSLDLQTYDARDGSISVTMNDPNQLLLFKLSYS